MSLTLLIALFSRYNVGEGLVNVSSSYYYNNLLGQSNSTWDWKIAGRNIIFMLVESVGYFGIVLLTESSLFQETLHSVERIRTRGIGILSGSMDYQEVHLDEDVKIENDLVLHSDPASFSLALVNIDKVYPATVLGGDPKYAVKQLCLGCPAGERFGLLGINGAGMRVLCALIMFLCIFVNSEIVQEKVQLSGS